MDAMGMTDKQFNGFVRFVLDDLKELAELQEREESKETISQKLKKVIDNLQKTLED